ncbi:hypothetical protein [Malikia spinosa]|uniref:hypothetical protein n=1 Tax=Malikia spinosa TaxID=86180 RepID=UPI003FA1B070
MCPILSGCTAVQMRALLVALEGRRIAAAVVAQHGNRLKPEQMRALLDGFEPGQTRQQA